MWVGKLVLEKPAAKGCSCKALGWETLHDSLMRHALTPKVDVARLILLSTIFRFQCLANSESPCLESRCWKSHLRCERSFCGFKYFPMVYEFVLLENDFRTSTLSRNQRGQSGGAIAADFCRAMKTFGPKKSRKTPLLDDFWGSQMFESNFSGTCCPKLDALNTKKGPKIQLGSEFQTFFIFNLTWGDDSIWLISFEWVETTNQKKSGPFWFPLKLFSRRPSARSPWRLMNFTSRGTCWFAENDARHGLKCRGVL